MSEQLTFSNDPALIKIAGNKVFGFWIYLMSDCILFAVLFASYMILSTGMIDKHDFNLPGVFIETCALLLSSFSFGLAILTRHRKNLLLIFLVITFIFGSIFVIHEIFSFYHLISTEETPAKNAFLSSYFSLVATHGLHVSIGLIWIALMIMKIIRQEMTITTECRLILLSLFWHFLDIIWICIYSLVYLVGSII